MSAAGRFLVGLGLVAAVTAWGIADDLGLFDPIGSASAHHARPAQASARAGGLDVPAGYLRAYRTSAHACAGLSWELLAGVGKVESNHGRGWPPRWRRTAGIARGTENFAGAGGPMQFLPGTWARYGRGGDRYDYRDAIAAAARLLCSGGLRRRPPDLAGALWAYNPSARYRRDVLAAAASYAKGVNPS